MPSTPPPPPPIVRVPGASSPTRSALPPPLLYSCRYPDSPYHRLRPPPGTYAATAAAAAARGRVLQISRPRYTLRRRRRRSRSCIKPTTEQTPATATSGTTRYVHPSLKLSAELSLPPEGDFEPFFYNSPTPPPETEANQLIILYLI
jgi:hypothetical protein